MKNLAQEIRIIVNQEAHRLANMNPDQVASKKTPDDWSAKEILGHLIDSAANNHQRFVRACYGAAADFPTYDQTEWVRIQQHNEADWQALIALWAAYNRHLGHVIEHIPQDALSAPCNIGREEPVTLEFVVKDYVRHLEHHLRDMGRMGE